MAVDRATRRAFLRRRWRRPSARARPGVRLSGLLFVAGEERGSDGAKAANTWPTTSAFLINGEPTDNRLGIATKGVYRARLTATGRAAHSSQPELGSPRSTSSLTRSSRSGV